MSGYDSIQIIIILYYANNEIDKENSPRLLLEYLRFISPHITQTFVQFYYIDFFINNIIFYFFCTSAARNILDK